MPLAVTDASFVNVPVAGEVMAMTGACESGV